MESSQFIKIQNFPPKIENLETAIHAHKECMLKNKPA